MQASTFSSSSWVESYFPCPAGTAAILVSFPGIAHLFKTSKYYVVHVDCLAPSSNRPGTAVSFAIHILTRTRHVSPAYLCRWQGVVHAATVLAKTSKTQAVMPQTLHHAGIGGGNLNCVLAASMADGMQWIVGVRSFPSCRHGYFHNPSLSRTSGLNMTGA